MRATRLKAAAEALAGVTAVEAPEEQAGLPNCCICLAEPVSRIARPCNHICMCDGCSVRLADRRCPMCRAAIHNLERVFI